MLTILMNFTVALVLFPIRLMFYMNSVFYGFIGGYMKNLISIFKTAV